MKEEARYQLEKYSGRSSRHECPQCGDPHSFTLYLDENNNIIDNTVGRCNHESGCGYHYTPSEWFRNHPTNNVYNNVTTKIIPFKPIIKPIDYINKKYLRKSISYKSNLIYFLCSLFDRATLESPTIERLMSDYYLGATKDEAVIYWQLDTNKKIRTGKIIKYDKLTGHRIHDINGINWVHSVLKKKGILPESFNLSQCLFGEHL